MKKTLLVVAVFLILGAVFSYLFFGLRIRGFRHGKLIERANMCEDYCPDEIRDKSWELIYYKVRTEEECVKIGGEVIISYAWGGLYRACGVE